MNPTNSMKSTTSLKPSIATRPSNTVSQSNSINPTNSTNPITPVNSTDDWNIPSNSINSINTANKASQMDPLELLDFFDKMDQQGHPTDSNRKNPINSINPTNVANKAGAMDPLDLLDFFHRFDQRDPSRDYNFMEEASEVGEEQQQISRRCLGRRFSFEDDIVENENPSEAEEEAVSSSGSSTIMSESTPHWAAFNEREPWGPDEIPPFRLSEYEQFDLTDEELAGILTDRFIAAGLSFISPSPFSYKYSLNKLKLSGKNIYDISRLEKFHYLQYVDLSRNYITDVSSLGNLPFLMYLDVSSNKLNTLLTFKAPLNLTYVNYSDNEVAFIDDLSEFWTIVQLNLSHNCISKIEGLHNLRFLRILDLSHNQITRIENINYLRLSQLYINNNDLTEFEEGNNIGLKTLPYLLFINLDYNRFSTLLLFKDTYSLERITMVENQISEVLELECLKTLVNLKELNLQHNPVTEWPEYRQIVISTVPSVSILDTFIVSIEEKVEAKINLDPDDRITAARYHTILLIMEQINHPVIEPHIIPVDENPLPIVILVGPEASYKGCLTRFAAEQIPDKVSAGVSHTSREKKENEKDGVHYYFVTRDKMHEMAHKGYFLTFSEIFGDSYGLDRKELSKAYERKCLCITHMDIIGARAMYNRGLHPHLVLTIAENEQVHHNRLKRKYRLKPDAPCGAPECQKDMCEALCTACADSAHLYRKKGTSGDEAIFSDSFVAGLMGDLTDEIIITARRNQAEKEREMKSKEMKMIIQSILNSRKTYFQLRDKGFFSSVVYTDHIHEAQVYLINILKRVYHLVANMPPHFSIDNDSAFKTAVPQRLKRYMDELNRHNPTQ